MELCLPILNGAQVQGYVIATYTLEGLLTLLPPGLTRAAKMSVPSAVRAANASQRPSGENAGS